MTFNHPALQLATNDHEGFRAALQLLKEGKEPEELTLEALRDQRRQMHGALPTLDRVHDLLESDQITNEEAMVFFGLHPEKKLL